MAGTQSGPHRMLLRCPDIACQSAAYYIGGGKRRLLVSVAQVASDREVAAADAGAVPCRHDISVRLHGQRGGHGAIARERCRYDTVGPETAIERAVCQQPGEPETLVSSRQEPASRKDAAVRLHYIGVILAEVLRFGAVKSDCHPLERLVHLVVQLKSGQQEVLIDRARDCGDEV